MAGLKDVIITGCFGGSCTGTPTLQPHGVSTATTTTEGTTQKPAEPVATSTDTEHETPAVSPEQQQRIDATAGTDRQIKTIQDWMDAEENRPETPEQRKKRERQEKSKRIIAAVSDGLSALSNLWKRRA